MESDTHLLYFTKLSGKSQDFYFLVGIHLNNNKYAYRQSQVRMPNGSGVRWAERLLIIGTGCRVQGFSLILDSSVGLSAGIESAEDWVSETLWVRILLSAEEDKLYPFDSKIACLCQSIKINNNK